jgi:hypothetical protein
MVLQKCIVRAMIMTHVVSWQHGWEQGEVKERSMKNY